MRVNNGDEAAALLWHVVHVQRRVRLRLAWTKSKRSRELALAALLATHRQKAEKAIREGLPPPRVSFSGTAPASLLPNVKAAPVKMRWCRVAASAGSSNRGFGSVIHRAKLLERGSDRPPDPLHLPVLLSPEEIYETLENAKQSVRVRGRV